MNRDLTYLVVNFFFLFSFHRLNLISYFKEAIYYSYAIRLTFIFIAIKMSNSLVCHECTEELPTTLKTFKGTIIDQLSTFGIGNTEGSDADFGEKQLNHFCKNLEDLGEPKTCDSGSLCLEFGFKASRNFIIHTINCRCHLFFRSEFLSQCMQC